MRMVSARVRMEAAVYKMVMTGKKRVRFGRGIIWPTTWSTCLHPNSTIFINLIFWKHLAYYSQRTSCCRSQVWSICIWSGDKSVTRQHSTYFHTAYFKQYFTHSLTAFRILFVLHFFGFSCTNIPSFSTFMLFPRINTNTLKSTLWPLCGAASFWPRVFADFCRKSWLHWVNLQFPRINSAQKHLCCLTDLSVLLLLKGALHPNYTQQTQQTRHCAGALAVTLQRLQFTFKGKFISQNFINTHPRLSL